MLIGVTGSKRSGKTTVGNFLRDERGFVHTSFAAPMRRFVGDLLGLTESQLDAAKELPVSWLDDAVTPRQMLQRLGTEFGRNLIHRDLWVRACIRRLDLSADTVVSDVRFANEAQAIRDFGGVIIHVVRRNLRRDADSHVSERGVPPDLIDAVVVNDGREIASFCAKIDRAVASLRRPPLA